jgi:hypothetical protein
MRGALLQNTYWALIAESPMSNHHRNLSVFAHAKPSYWSSNAEKAASMQRGPAQENENENVAACFYFLTYLAFR